MDIRIGFGIDVHRLEADIPLFIGGVQIPSTFGAVGHSDADVLLHALADAILGAAGLRDIGHYFPNTDPTLKGIDSALIVKKALSEIAAKGWKVGNVDLVIGSETPIRIGTLKDQPYLHELVGGDQKIQDFFKS